MHLPAPREYNQCRVSMKSGLEGRNNTCWPAPTQTRWKGLNEVRPRRPEQFFTKPVTTFTEPSVSMKSGLEGRNNACDHCKKCAGS